MLTMAHDHDAHDHDHGHDHDGHDHHQPLCPRISARLRRSWSLLATTLVRHFADYINEGETAQAVSPIRVISDSFKPLASARHIASAPLALTVLIIVVAGVGVMVSV